MKPIVLILLFIPFMTKPSEMLFMLLTLFLSVWCFTVNAIDLILLRNSHKVYVTHTKEEVNFLKNLQESKLSIKLLNDT